MSGPAKYAHLGLVMFSMYHWGLDMHSRFQKYEIIHLFKHASAWKYASMQVCIYPSKQVCNCIQVLKYAMACLYDDMHVCNSMQVCRYAIIQSGNYESMQICKFEGIHVSRACK